MWNSDDIRHSDLSESDSSSTITYSSDLLESDLSNFSDTSTESPSNLSPVVTFKAVKTTTPWNQCNIQLYQSFLELQLQHIEDWQIQYSSIVDVFVLPKSRELVTYVVITLDSSYQTDKFIVIEFNTDDMVEKTLKYHDKLQASYKGLIHDVFTIILQGLSMKKITTLNNNGHAVQALFKFQISLLYPLDDCFFILPRRPTLVHHHEIEYLGFKHSRKQYRYDLVIKLKTSQEHVLVGLHEYDYDSLLAFIRSKGTLHIKNLKEKPDVEVPNCTSFFETDEENEAIRADKPSSITRKKKRLKDMVLKRRKIQ